MVSGRSLWSLCAVSLCAVTDKSNSKSALFRVSDKDGIGRQTTRRGSRKATESGEAVTDKSNSKSALFRVSDKDGIGCQTTRRGSRRATEGLSQSIGCETSAPAGNFSATRRTTLHDDHTNR